MRIFKKQDRKAPRFRATSYRHRMLDKLLYTNYISKFNDGISWEEFKGVIEAVSIGLVDKAIDEREGVALPGQMGSVRLVFYNVGKNVASYTTDEGIQVRPFNFETKGYLGKIVWTFKDCIYKVKNRELYAFSAHRDFKVKASKSFIENAWRYKVDGSNNREEKEKAIKLENECKLKRSTESGEGSE